jgi:hypothetical protein
VKPLRHRVLPLLGALAILLGLLVPAAAMPCAAGDGAPMSCDLCLGVLPGTLACASTSQAVAAPDPTAARASLTQTRVRFDDFAVRPYGFHPAPDFPPPR